MLCDMQNVLNRSARRLGELRRTTVCLALSERRTFWTALAMCSIVLVAGCGPDWPRVVELDGFVEDPVYLVSNLDDAPDHWVSNLNDDPDYWPDLDGWIDEWMEQNGMTDELEKARQVSIRHSEELMGSPNVRSVGWSFLVDEEGRYLQVIGIQVYEYDEWLPGISVVGRLPDTLDGVPVQIVRIAPSMMSINILTCFRWCFLACQSDCNHRLFGFESEFGRIYRPQNLRE